jgi:hypothetical protein
MIGKVVLRQQKEVLEPIPAHLLENEQANLPDDAHRTLPCSDVVDSPVVNVAISPIAFGFPATNP